MDTLNRKYVDGKVVPGTLLSYQLSEFRKSNQNIVAIYPMEHGQFLIVFEE